MDKKNDLLQSMSEKSLDAFDRERGLTGSHLSAKIAAGKTWRQKSPKKRSLRAPQPPIVVNVIMDDKKAPAKEQELQERMLKQIELIEKAQNVSDSDEDDRLEQKLRKLEEQQRDMLEKKRKDEDVKY